MGLDLVSTVCAICERPGNATVIYPANFDAAAFTPQVFSARRLPDLLHYQIVCCNVCGLLRSDPVADSATLAQLYRESDFTYSRDTPNLAKTYRRYLQRAERYGLLKTHLLEIGCGDGFFLQAALAHGFAHVSGVEPAQAAIQKAAPHIRQHIQTGMMRPGLFAPETFSAICLFQTLDHIAAPNELLAECWRVLQPGGIILCLNHNVEAFSARMLKEKSPIIDIEHTYLYSPQTLRLLFEKHGFITREVKPAFNIIRLHSLLRLMPLPRSIKQKLLPLFEPLNLNLTLPLGNLYIIAQKNSVNNLL